MQEHTHKNSRETTDWQACPHSNRRLSCVCYICTNINIHSEVHPSLTYTSKHKKQTGSWHTSRLHLFTPFIRPRPLASGCVHMQTVDETFSHVFRSTLSSRHLEESFDFLQVHLLPAGQTPVLLSGHLQGFLWEQPCTPSAWSSHSPTNKSCCPR